MPLISASTIIVSVSLVHIVLSYLLFTKPAVIGSTPLVHLLGDSMQMNYTDDFNQRSDVTALLSVVLGLVALGDLLSLTMPEEVSQLYYWGTQAPLRFSFAMASLAYSYTSSPSHYFPNPSNPKLAHCTPFQAPSSITFPFTQNTRDFDPACWGPGLHLKNRVFFTFMFVQLFTWFWVWITLREERPAVVDRLRRVRKREMQL